jgi:hypothetical protein
MPNCSLEETILQADAAVDLAATGRGGFDVGGGVDHFVDAMLLMAPLQVVA